MSSYAVVAQHGLLCVAVPPVLPLVPWVLTGYGSHSGRSPQEFSSVKHKSSHSSQNTELHHSKADQ